MIYALQEHIDSYTAKGWWGEKTLWDYFLESLHQFPDQEAVVDAPNRLSFAHGEPQRWSWKTLAEHTDKVALSMLKSGIKRDDIVVVQLPNCVEQIAVFLACARLGIILSPVPVQYREHELNHVLKITEASAVITFTRIGKVEQAYEAAHAFIHLKDKHPPLHTVLCWGLNPPPDTTAIESGPISEKDRQTIASATSNASISANDIFTLCWTSGTEAEPKGVPRSHNEWILSGQAVAQAAKLQKGARLLNPFPLVNMSGISGSFTSWLLVGGTVIQHHPFDLPIFLQQLREEKIDYTVAPPTILTMMLKNPDLLDGIDFKRLQRMGTGSAPLSPWLVKGFETTLGVEIVNYYGSNEGASLCGAHDDIPDAEMRAQFFPRAGVPGFQWRLPLFNRIQTRLVDLDTEEEITENGFPGELRFAGPSVFSQYFRAPAMTANAFDAQGFYKTGDLFEIAGEQQQYYRFVGRSKDLVIRGGMNISSEEIEILLASHPDILEVAIVGYPDERLGEKICACVVEKLPGTVSLDSIKAFLLQEKKVAMFKLPEKLMVVPALPRNPVGKILKRVLRETLASKSVH
jgi:acyl-CoA synthetase (AMP-forming)/AMP-acid ligase II